MNIIKQNPFRVLGIVGNAKERELQKQINIIKRFAEIGKTKTFDYDFNFLGEVPRSLDDVQQAASNIEQANKKIIYSLFWFINHNNFDEIAFNNLKDQQVEKAIEIWSKTLKDDVTEKNFSSYLNLSTLYIALSAINEQIEIQKLQKGIQLKANLIQSEALKDFSHLVTGNGVANDSTEISKKFVDETIDLLNPYLNKTKGISTNDLISLFEDFPIEIKKYISSKFTEAPISNIENQIDRTTKSRKSYPGNANEYGETLYKSTKNEIVLLSKLLGKSNVQLQMLVDKVADEIMQCSIDYFNEKQEEDSDDFDTFLNNAIDLVKLANSIAISQRVKNRAKENIDTLNEMRERDILQAVQFLQSVKDAYIVNENEIRQKVRELEATDLDIIRGYKTINHSAVSKSIRESIDWGKVNVLLRELLTDSSLIKIKQSSKNELKKEFADLANWLKDNSLDNSLISRLIEKYNKIPPKLPFKILSSEVTNTDGKPLYTKLIRFIGIQLNIKVVEEGSTTLYFKYITPDGSVKRNSKTSPKGYTISQTKTVNKQTKSFELPGWGNAKECTYKVGKHKIEIYFDDYMIHRKEFIVELAPSEKLEIELKKAEKELKNINNTAYFNSEYKTAIEEMNEIQKFQLFRSSTTKQSQISSQQRKIDDIKQKADAKKRKNAEKQHEIIYKLKSDIQNAEY